MHPFITGENNNYNNWQNHQYQMQPIAWKLKISAQSPDITKNKIAQINNNDSEALLLSYMYVLRCHGQHLMWHFKCHAYKLQSRVLYFINLGSADTKGGKLSGGVGRCAIEVVILVWPQQKKWTADPKRGVAGTTVAYLNALNKNKHTCTHTDRRWYCNKIIATHVSKIFKNDSRINLPLSTVIVNVIRAHIYVHSYFANYRLWGYTAVIAICSQMLDLFLCTWQDCLIKEMTD